MFEIIRYMIKNRKGQFSNLSKLIIALALGMILLAIIMYYIVPNLNAQSSNVEGTLGILK